jgi:nitrogenase subunit NifH
MFRRLKSIKEALKDFKKNNSIENLVSISNSNNMFSLFRKDPIKQSEKKYLQLMEEARDLQRSGDLKAYAKKIAESEELQQKIEDLKAAKQSK